MPDPLLAAEGVTRTMADRTILDAVSIAIGEGDHVGLLGANGAGKTTLLRILAGIESPEEGRVVRRRGIRLGYLAQEADLDDARTVGEEARAAQDELRAKIARMEAIDERVDAEHRADRELVLVAQKLGLPPADRLCGSLSGGEKRRVALAKVLLSEPDLLLLDEPTNHLDAETIDWLEEHLIETRSAALIVTHDRFFLDRVCRRIVEIDGAHLHVTEGGGYARFLEQREARLEREESTETARRAFLRAELLWLKSGVKAQRRKGKERVEKVKALRAEIGVKAEIPPELQLKLPGGPRLGQKVLTLEGASKSLGGRKLFDGLTVRLAAGERLGVVGRNGVGKTTLLRLMQGLDAPDAGTVEVGPNTRFAYIDQSRAHLDDANTVFEEVARDAQWIRIGDETITARAYLAKFLFPGDRQQTKVGELSGGERNRLALAKLLRAGGNVIILDEPTNDLDLVTLRALEEALIAFEGAAVVVSHDRWFLERVATRTLGLEGEGKWAVVEGGYEDYRAARREREQAAAQAARAAASAAPAPAAGKRPAQKLTAKEKNELDRMSKSIEDAEAEAERLSKALEDPTLYSNAARRDEARSLAAALEAARAKVTTLYARWEDLETKKSGS